MSTKGREELDLPRKMARLKERCADASAADEDGQRYDFVYVDQAGFEKHSPKHSRRWPPASWNTSYKS